jgi:transcription elongation factor Elf1
MPRIVKTGSIPYPVILWQTTTPFRCRHCGCEWYAEQGEWIDVRPLVASDAGCAKMRCPNCGTLCQIREPGKPIARGLVQP